MTAPDANLIASGVVGIVNMSTVIANMIRGSSVIRKPPKLVNIWYIITPKKNQKAVRGKAAGSVVRLYPTFIVL